MPLAGLVIGLVIHFLGKPGEIGVIVDNIHFRGGRLDARKNPSMILTSLVGISAGGSAGPEAPLVQVTGSFGTWFAGRMGIEGENLRSMSIAGMAAGFTALFGAPLGGAMFALEILHHQHVLEYYEALLPAIVSSCASYIVYTMITHLGIAPAWHFPQYRLQNIDDFALDIVFGIIGAMAGWLFMGIFRAGDRKFCPPSRTNLSADNSAVTRTPVSTTLLLSKLSGFSPLTPILNARLIGFFLAPKAPLIKSQLKSQPEAITE